MDLKISINSLFIQPFPRSWRKNTHWHL